MKHHPLATANATAATVAIIYLVCAFAVAFFPDLSMSIARNWFHGIDLTEISSYQLTLGSLTTGFVTATIGSWLVGFIYANIYNGFLKK